MNQRSECNTSGANLVRQVALSSFENINVVFKPVYTFTAYTDDEALALIVSNKLTKHQYLNIRSGSIKRGIDMYPSYHMIIEAKKKCYPNNITITEQSAEIQLQSLIDHLAKRLVQITDPFLHTLPPTYLSNLILTIK